MISVAILGAGALGSVIGAFLARAGRDIALWDVNDAHIQAVRSQGLVFDGPNGREVLNIPAMRPEDAEETPDLIILLTKTIHTGAALAGIADHIAAGAHVLTLQNGLGNADRVAEQVPTERVLYGCTMMPGRFVAPGHVATQGNGSAVFRALTPRGEEFGRSAQISTDGFALVTSPDTDQIIWQKAAFNCAMNACSGLTGARVGDLADCEGMRPLLHAVAAEVVELAKAESVAADYNEVTGQIAHALAHHTEHKASMLQDIEAERETEIESLCGEVARQAERLGRSAPLNAGLAAMIRQKSSLYRAEVRT